MSLEAVRASLGVLSVALCVLMAIFLLCSGGSLRRANRYLAAFMLVTAVDLLGWVALLLPEAARQPLLLRTPLAFLQMPLLYAYAVALCFPQRRRRGHLLGGGLLVLLAAAVLLPRALAWLAPATSAGGAGSNLDQVLIELGLHLQFYLYIGLLLHLLWQYRHQYRATQSHPGSLTLRWLATVVAVSFAAHSLVLLKSLLWIGGAPAGREGMDLLVGVVAVAVMCAMTLAALVRQELFIGIVEEPVPLPDPTPSVAGAAGFDSDGHDDDCNDDPGALPRLLDYMQQHQPFLDPGLTIRGLARRMGMGQRELSVLINQRIGLHFFDFINRYRIELAAAWLRAPERRQQSILEIADAVGFNSKSSFNAAFSKHLQMTPSAWRRATAAATGPLPLS